MTMRYQKNEDGTVTTVEDTKYSGWANYETWNVALYINNESNLYFAAREFAKDWFAPKPKHKRTYLANGIYYAFIRSQDLQDRETPDGVRWLDPKVARYELNEMFREELAAE